MITYGLELNACAVRHRAGYDFFDNDGGGLRYVRKQTTLPAEMVTTIEELRISLRAYRIVGGYPYRRTVYHGLVVHYDNDGVRTIFQAVYVHGSRSDTAFHFCRRAVAECGQELYKELLCRFA